MFALGLGTTWLGYSLVYYGLTQVQSGNWGYFDLVLPSRAANLSNIARDDGSARTPPPNAVVATTKKLLLNSGSWNQVLGQLPGIGPFYSGLKKILP